MKSLFQHNLEKLNSYVMMAILNISLSLTNEKQLLSKSTVVKMDSEFINKDFVFEYIGGIDKIYNIDSTNRIYGIFILLAKSSLFYANGDIVNVSKEAETFANYKV